MRICNCNAEYDSPHSDQCHFIVDMKKAKTSDGGPDIASLNDPVRTKKATAISDEELRKMKPDSITGNDHGVMREEGMRTFPSGATRDADDKKHDFEGFLSPWAIRRYGAYMHSHRIQADGKMRDSDNWQKGSGIPLEVYVKSLLRHTFDVWSIHRGLSTFDTKDGHEVDIEDALCAILFNAFGALHEYLKASEVPPEERPPTDEEIIKEAAKFQKRRNFADAARLQRELDRELDPHTELQKRVDQAAGNGVEVEPNEAS